MPNPNLQHLPPRPPKQRRSSGLLKYLVIAAIGGSLLRLFPAINIFSAADNVGIIGSSDYTGLGASPIGAVGSPYGMSYAGNAGIPTLGSSYYSSSYSPDEAIPKIYSTPLIRAASNGDTQKVIELLTDGVPVNGRDSEKRTALIAAAYYGKNDICTLLIDNAASLNATDKDGFSALDFAAARGLVDTVKLLLKKSKKSDTDNHIEYAMMMQAAFSSIIQFMPKGKGYIPSINRISPEDKFPLYVAANGGSVDLVGNLLKRGAKVNLQNKNGQTALHSAAISNKNFVISLLLKESAKINIADAKGNTPLLLAAEQNQKETVLLLLAKGADKNLHNKKGEDATAMAKNKGFTEITALLQK